MFICQIFFSNLQTILFISKFIKFIVPNITHYFLYITGKENNKKYMTDNPQKPLTKSTQKTIRWTKTADNRLNKLELQVSNIELKLQKIVKQIESTSKSTIYSVRKQQ